MDEKLKPCPFCGGTEHEHTGKLLSWNRCMTCGARGPLAAKGKGREAWDNRAAMEEHMVDFGNPDGTGCWGCVECGRNYKYGDPPMPKPLWLDGWPVCKRCWDSKIYGDIKVPAHA